MFAAVTTVAAQSEADAQRFKQLGVAESDCKVTGSIKFDIAIADTVREQAAALKAQWSLGGERIVWIAASTHEGEEVAILEALTQLKHKTKAKILLVLVPRHPERFNTVAALCDEQGLSMVRRSSGLIPSDTVDVLVGDSMGEMLLLLGAADIAFVGGSLIERGGHNMLEPAAWGLPILTGSSDFNFMEISRLLIEAGALHKVAGVDDLAESMTLLIDENKRKAQGDAALRVVEANRGSLGRLLEILVGFIR